MFNRILCPIDFSNRSRGAAHAARALALRFNSEIVALHVLPHDSDAAQVAEAERTLGDVVIHDFEKCRVAPCVVTGYPAERILQFAHDRRIDLVVMPTHGLSPFRRFALGSIASKVLHLATCPVWTSCHLENWPAVDSLPMRLIVCALDFGPRSCAALHWASRLARDFDAKLTLAHVIRPDESTPMEPPEETLRRQRQTLHVACDTRILEGMPAPVLSALAEETDADLMVIGRTHASSPGLGANAYAIIAHAPCPVLSV